MTTRADVVAEARTWLGTKWIHQHRAKGQGVDCAGLIICVVRDLGLLSADFDINGYSRMPDGTLLAVCDEHMDRIDRSVAHQTFESWSIGSRMAMTMTATAAAAGADRDRPNRAIPGVQAPAHGVA